MLCAPCIQGTLVARIEELEPKFGGAARHCWAMPLKLDGIKFSILDTRTFVFDKGDGYIIKASHLLHPLTLLYGLELL